MLDSYYINCQCGWDGFINEAIRKYHAFQYGENDIDVEPYDECPLCGEDLGQSANWKELFQAASCNLCDLRFKCYTTNGTRVCQKGEISGKNL